MYFEMPALRRGKISACNNMPFNCTSNVSSGLYGFNPCTFCSTLYRAQTRSFLAHIM